MSARSAYLAYDFRGEKLPSVLPLFPVDGMALFPKNQLPLPIASAENFSTLASVLYQHRLMGIVQPFEKKGALDEGLFFPFGTAGKIIDIQQSEEGQLYATVLGVCRFSINNVFSSEEKEPEKSSIQSTISPDLTPSLALLETVFRQNPPKTESDTQTKRWFASVDYAPFEHDLAVDVDFSVNRDVLLKEARHYFKRFNMASFLNEVDEVSDDYLVTTLAAVSPFSIGEKQALLQAPNISKQAQLMLDFFKMSNHYNHFSGIKFH